MTIRKVKEWWERRNYEELKIRVWSTLKKRFLDRSEYSLHVSPCGRVTAEPREQKDKLVVQLSTGCFDMDKQEVYEGDVVRTDEGNWTGVVVFAEGKFYLAGLNGGFSSGPGVAWNYSKITGNILQDGSGVKSRFKRLIGSSFKVRVWSVFERRHLKPGEYWLKVQKSGRLVAVPNKVDRLVIQMFTGCLDSEGRDVYEGDIIETDREERGCVIYRDCSFCSLDRRLIGEELNRLNIHRLGNIGENEYLMR